MTIVYAGAEYEVLRRDGYRGHELGSRFEAILDPNAERRALIRGDIRVVARTTPSVQPGSFAFPDGWLQQQEVG